ncbi:alpha-2-macroglobulin family protein [Deinococcus arenicola]|uniref:MG2 domain-containing protein n=1 Tax=Deinococcus arenicola TaxID=2994950 RepID=A0ABU4DSL6_9DEIO|nr:MG2 domain-containing protein [Deinococcus sp. ZS9-10]MDV6375426.1 MG2 domain-containing protein [Deinococcus sp. ZS9-10]
MKQQGLQRRWTRGVLVSGLLLMGLAPAQREVSIYGGVFRGGQAVRVDAYAPAGTVFTLRRVLDPAALFAASPDPHRPQVTALNRSQPIRTVKSKQSDQTLDFGKLPSGVYMVGTGSLGAVVLVSNLGMVVKRDQNAALTYTADRESGQTRAARVWALGGKSPVLATADGVARFAKKADADEDKETYLARFGNDWAISGANWNSYAAPLVRGYVYTDRPIYRPGQHVDFKAVLRQADKLTPLASTSVRVTITSPNSDEVYRKTLTTNALGSLNAGLDLPVGAKLGEYYFSLRPDGADGDGQSEIGGSFQVEAYQKPEYAVTLTPDRKRAVQGEKVSIRISGRYLFGGNVSGARVNYNVTRARYYPPGFDSTYLPPDDEGSDYGSDLVIQEETRLNANGDLDLMLPLARDPDGQPVSYRIEAEAEDESRRTVSAQTQVIAFPASLNVEASTDGYVYDAGKPIRVSLDTRDLKDVARAAPVTLDLIRQNYEYDKKKKIWVLSETRMARSQVSTNAAGMATTTLSTPRGGGYLVRATVKDAQGRASTFENFVWVLKPGEDYGWNYRDLTVQLDRKSYAPGDTATVLVGNPKPGAPVLVTLEGDKLRSSTVLRGTGAVLTYRFPVTADMAPNISVAAATLSDGQFYSNDARVKVPRAGAALTVKVTPEKARYGPGDTGKFSVDIKAADGKGVAGEVALGVVDGAIYLVQRDNSTPIAQVFDEPRSNVVGTNSSLNFYFSQAGSVASAPMQMEDAPAFAQEKSGVAAAPSSNEVIPRQDFKDTILWVPNLLTDAQGHAEVTVKFPDNLTTWVATARAQTQTPRFGQATATTMTTKDVIARLSLPTFLVRGDTVTLSGIVNNTLNKSVTGTASAVLGGLTPLGGAVLKPGGTPLNVAANGRVRTDMQVRAGNVGTANVTFTARTASGNDALKLPLPVKARGYEVTTNGVGSASNPSVKINIPADANLKTLDLSLSLTPSLLSAVSPALEYLVGYPYGCTEQTMSRFLPALLAKENMGSAALPAGVVKDLPDIVSAGLTRLELFQHDDGGWNFWQYDDSTLEMTAYVVEGLLRAKSLGAKVNNAMLDNGLKYLSRDVNNAKLRQAERSRAFRALATAGRVNTTQLAAFARRKDLEPYALAQTAMALSNAGQTQAARDVLDRLKAKRIGTNSGALLHWETPKRGGGDSWYDYWDDNSVQVTATALEAIATLEPDSALIPGVSQWMLSNRRGPKWLSTQDTTSAIVAALALKPAKAITGNVSALLDGKNAGQATLTGQEAATLRIDASALKAGPHTVTVKGAPAGLTFSTQLKYSREPAELKGDASKGFRLSRQYQRLEPVWDAKNNKYTYRRVSLLKGGQMQPVTVGDLILVTLSVQPVGQSARYMVVSDPIPAGMKALDERSLAITGLQDPDEYGWDNWNYWYAGRDLLDDRVDLYADYLKGEQKMTYLLRAQTPGTFTALPTHAFLMYDPDVEGYAPATTFTVRDRGQ